MRQIQNFLLLSLVLILIIGCSSGRRTVSINSVRPADISVNNEINSILILNRTKYSKDIIGVIEGILTGELPEEDKAGIQSFANELKNQIRNSDRFTAKVASENLEGNSLTQAFPDQLSWALINKFCRQYNTDGVIAIEIFDSDFIITDGKRKVTKENDDGEGVEVDEYYAEGISNITIGIRFYDPIDRSIVDQDIFRKTNTWNASGLSKNEAIASLINKTDAIRNLSGQVGSNYAFKIAPMPVRISRSFTGKSKKSPVLEQGSIYADVSNWEKAIEVWKTGIASAPIKEAGFLTQNIAIAYEVLGDLDNARKWAERSYTQYGNKNARSYISLLENRIFNEQLAGEQMGN
ncbi:DUF6340 family protein [Ekhidna sp.]|uniref:DUF6340 family protein n=1 Tax=Ekhidna sp. TaxID=2608089 RepID=UPI003B514185